ncbi:hypothetical protein C1752_03386 [Acaryochloris thomasi RCC1774]|uniref:Uncharacterized protein n=1 Tax=Acaryochloris thomasi RCC1774 TaxID=1764569 RepID=A0A2W1JUR9_9CYAN|nr:hypothetical protein [Acaryochloris thomasi]PZD72551.1 hypothetical protein C1752_03386 [Acaryochloris thomasi RCC1774]
MRLVPYHTFTLQTDSPQSLVFQRLQEQVEPVKLLRLLLRDHAPYQGVVSEESFKIHRIIHYRNSFLPVIRGRFEEQGDMTLVHVTMSFHPVVSLFLGVWLLFWYGFTVPIAIANLTTNLFPTGIGLVFLGMPLLFLMIAWFAFWGEANRSQRDLEKFLLASV